MNRRLLFAVSAAFTAFISQLPAQDTTATVNGKVSDTSSAAVPSAKVLIDNAATHLSRAIKTGNDGTFTFAFLPPGMYRLTVEKAGFSQAGLDVVLEVGTQESLRIPLQVGDIHETISVDETASRVQDSPAVGTVIDRQFAANLPLNGRSFQSLLALTPGVVRSATSSFDGGQFSVNGQRPNANYFTVDGVSANVGVATGSFLAQSGTGSLPSLGTSGGTQALVSVDALREFRVLTSTCPPGVWPDAGGTGAD